MIGNQNFGSKVEFSFNGRAAIRIDTGATVQVVMSNSEDTLRISSSDANGVDTGTCFLIGEHNYMIVDRPRTEGDYRLYPLKRYWLTGAVYRRIDRDRDSFGRVTNMVPELVYPSIPVMVQSPASANKSLFTSKVYDLKQADEIRLEDETFRVNAITVLACGLHRLDVTRQQPTP